MGVKYRKEHRVTAYSNQNKPLFENLIECQFGLFPQRMGAWQRKRKAGLIVRDLIRDNYTLELAYFRTYEKI